MSLPLTVSRKRKAAQDLRRYTRRVQTERKTALLMRRLEQVFAGELVCLATAIILHLIWGC